VNDIRILESSTMSEMIGGSVAKASRRAFGTGVTYAGQICEECSSTMVTSSLWERSSTGLISSGLLVGNGMRPGAGVLDPAIEVADEILVGPAGVLDGALEILDGTFVVLGCAGTGTLRTCIS
jgi:hypothetical protein